MSIPANQTSFNFDNVFTGALPYLVIVGLETDVDQISGYQRNMFNFHIFGVNPMDLKRMCRAKAIHRISQMSIIKTTTTC